MQHKHNVHSWQWVRARAIGTAHMRYNIECQDFVICRKIATSTNSILAAVVSDGAGSVPRAARGAKVTCQSLIRAIRNYFQEDTTTQQENLDTIDEDIIRGWIDEIRVRLTQISIQEQRSLHDYSATLVAVLANHKSALVIHIGDGAAVVRTQGSQEWYVPSWPFHGIYASMTVFVTSCDFEQYLRIIRLPMPLDRIAVFSDGLEHLVLDHVKKCAHIPFFDKIFKPLEASDLIGHHYMLSDRLKHYLASDNVCQYTHDDTSLILACYSASETSKTKTRTYLTFKWLASKQYKEQEHQKNKKFLWKNKRYKKRKQK